MEKLDSLPFLDPTLNESVYRGKKGDDREVREKKTHQNLIIISIHNVNVNVVYM